MQFEDAIHINRAQRSRPSAVVNNKIGCHLHQKVDSTLPTPDAQSVPPSQHSPSNRRSQRKFSTGSGSSNCCHQEMPTSAARSPDSGSSNSPSGQSPVFRSRFLAGSPEALASFSLRSSSQWGLRCVHEESSICGSVHAASWGRQSGSWTAAKLPGSSQSSLLAGLFSPVGHSGRQCATATAALVADYVAAAVVDPEDALAARRHLLVSRSASYNRRDWNNNGGGSETRPGISTSLRSVDSQAEYVPEDLLGEARCQWLPSFLLKRSRRCHLRSQRGAYGGDDDLPNEIGGLAERLCDALEQLDVDLCSQAIIGGESWAKDVASTGATGITCLITQEERMCYLAQTGDTVAVIGSKASDGWLVKQPLNAHTIENGREVCRLVAEHPAQAERSSLFEGNCLLGELEPLRAFGLARFKWPVEHLVRLMQKPPRKRSSDGSSYLTARPEVAEVQLEPEDKFIVLGSAGFWECISPEDAVKLVGDQLSTEGDRGNLAGSLIRCALEQTSPMDAAAAWASAVSACVVILH